MSERRSDPDNDEPAASGSADPGEPTDASPEDSAATADTDGTEQGATSAAEPTPESPDEPPAEEPPPADETAAPAGPRRGGRPVWLALALLIAVAAAGAAGYLGWRLYQLEQRVAAIPQERAAALDPLARRAELEQLEQRVDTRLQEAISAKAEELAAARQKGLDALRERLGTLEQGVREIRELAARDQVGWRLAEIRYLLGVAQRRLLIAQDTRSAIAALEAADRAIADLGSVRLLPLRQRIVDNLATLRAVEPADVEGIALRLQNLLARVDGLPAAVPEGRAGDGGNTADAGTGGGWWARVTAGLDRFVSVQHRDAGPARGRPEPAAELPQADRLVLALEQARQAALARNPEAYERALQRARDALAAGFASDAEDTRRFEAALGELRQRRVVADLPNLDETLDLARRLSARLESEPASPSAPADGDDSTPESAGTGAQDSGADDAGATPAQTTAPASGPGNDTGGEN